MTELQFLGDRVRNISPLYAMSSKDFGRHGRAQRNRVPYEGNRGDGKNEEFIKASIRKREPPACYYTTRFCS